MPWGKDMRRFCCGIFLYADLQSTQSITMCAQVPCMDGEAQNTYLKDLLTGDIFAV